MNHRTMSIVPAVLLMFATPTFAWAQQAPPPPPPATPPPPPDAAIAHQDVAPAPQIFLKEPASAMFAHSKVTLINFIEFDAFHDSTQTYQDSFGGPIVRSNTYGGQHGRENFLARNSQFGLQVDGPEFWGMKPGAHCRMDFMGQQPGTPQNGTSEYSFTNSATMRLFHCFGYMNTPYVDVMGGITYSLLGNEPFFFPASLTFLPIPGMTFTRTVQFRLSHQFSTPHIDFFIGAAAGRPPQRDAEVPDGIGALRIGFNDWKGAHTIGAVGLRIDPLSIGVSGLMRTFRVQERAVNPTSSNTENGAAISLDAFIPIIPAKALTDTGNTMAGTVDFTTGYGYSDAVSSNTTAGIPAQTRLAAPGAAPGAAAPAQLDIDPGIAIYDSQGFLHAVKWQSIQFGLQYRLPGPGNLWIYGNYAYLKSDNIATLLPPKPGAVSTIFKNQAFVSAGLGWAIIPNFQVGFEYSKLDQTFLDEGTETNHRFSFATYYIY